MGSDTQLAKEVAPPVNFNSRSLHGERYLEDNVILFDLKISILVPCVGSDDELLREAKASTISILAPCLGSDILNCTEDLIHINFNSHSLRGER